MKSPLERHMTRSLVKWPFSSICAMAWAPAKEIAYHRRERLWIDQLLWRHRIHALIEQSHSLFHQTFGPGQTDATLVGQKFTYRSDAPAAEMIDVIEGAFTFFQAQQILR